jgi:hypothetical protein
MFKHFIFTRWNLMDDQQSVYNNPLVPDPEEWMIHREKLFDELTLPSVMLQTCKNFTWLLAFAPETPVRILRKYASFPNVHIIHEYPQTYLRKMLANSQEWIITSRMDNDDTIAPEYVELVQAQFDEKFLLVDTDGVQLDLATGKTYTVERRSNNSPFISLIEKTGTDWMSISDDPAEKRLIIEPVKTCYFCSHSKMEWHFPSVKIQKRLYTMVIHDRNVCNKIVGHEIL